MTNTYDPSSTDGIEIVVVVGDERRVWMTHPEGTCLIMWSEGDKPTDCKVTPRHDEEAATDPSTAPDAPEEHTA